jgi:hypothetical protein
MNIKLSREILKIASCCAVLVATIALTACTSNEYGARHQREPLNDLVDHHGPGPNR